MARLFTSGFELQSFDQTVGRSGSYIEWDDSTTTTKVAVETTIKNSGNASAKVYAATAGKTDCYREFASATVLYAKFDLYVSAAPGADTSIFTFLGPANNYYVVSGVALFQNRTLKAFYPGAGGTGTFLTASAALTLNKWYCVELYTKINSSTSVDISMKLNGVTVNTDTNLTTTMGGTTSMNGLSFGGAITDLDADTTFHHYFDNLIVNDNTGSYENSWVGDQKVITLRPNAAGDSAGWTRAGTDSGANYSQCNNTPPNDVTSYVLASTLNALDMYNMDTPGLSSNVVIKCVDAGMRFNRSASSSPSIKLRLRKTANGTNLDSAELQPNATEWKSNANAAPFTSPIISYVDPDGSAWTSSTIDSMQVGVIESTDTTKNVYVSDVWANVSYNYKPTVALDYPADAQTVYDGTPMLKFTGSDTESNSIKYNIQVDTVNTFNSLGSTSSVIDSYSETNQSTDVSVGYLQSARGQSFTTGSAAAILKSCKFYLRKVGSPTGNAVAKLYALSGSYGGGDDIPTGSALATSDNFSVSTLTASYQLITFTFTGAQQYSMSANTGYCITVEASGFDLDNRVEVGIDNTSANHTGNHFFNQSGWTTSGASGYDTIFYVYADDSRPIIDNTSGTNVGFSGTRLYDQFTNTNSTDISAHTGDTDGTWTEHTSYTSGAMQINSNRAYVQTGASCYYSSFTPPSADYAVSADLYVFSNVGDAGVVGRVDTAANTLYLFRYYNGNWELYKGIAGTFTLLDSEAVTINTSQTYNVMLEMIGTSIKGYVDGVEKCSATDSSISSAGKAGIRGYIAVTTSTGLHFDKFFVLSGANGTVSPYVAGTAGYYTVQSQLNNATHYWRVRAIDEYGSNVYGDWATTRSFTPSSVVTQSKTVQSKVDIKQLSVEKTVQAKTRIKKEFTNTVETRLRIKALTEKTVLSKTNIKNTTDRTVLAKARTLAGGVTKTIESKVDIKVLGNDRTVSSKTRILSISANDISAVIRIKSADVQKEVNAKINIESVQANTLTETVQSKVSVVCITFPSLVHPVISDSELNPVTLEWTIPTCCQERNMHCEVQIDSVSDAFNNIEKDIFSYRDPNFEYWTGSEWLPYPTTGVLPDYYGNDARVMVYLTSGVKYWRVRGLVK